MGFKSIQTRYILLVSISVIVSALLIGTACVTRATESSLRDAAEIMNLTCESYVNRYDISLKNVQGAVEDVADFASIELESLERFAGDEQYREEYAKRLESALRLETLNAPAVTSYYIRFSPDLLSFERGFRYLRDDNGELQSVPIVRIQDYQESDDEYVSWYFTPIENGTTTWLDPYYNANFGMKMVSCVAPFYKDGELVGVVGMDISFSTLVDDLSDLKVFDTGYAFLCGADGEIFYHPLYEQGTYIQQDVVGFDAQLEDGSSGDFLYSGISKGEEVEYAFRTLTNGMRLVLRAPDAEISAEAMHTINTILMLMGAVVAFSILVTVLASRRIIKPLKEITAAAAEITRGNYDIKLNVTAQDEVGTLARALQEAAIELKESSQYMEDLAYRDTLTGVKNKTAYDQEISLLEKEIAEGTARFGIAVFDVNDLKTANDVYGHEQGDKVIRTGCSRICRTFVESPVYRVGGDEFVAVLQGNELERADSLLAIFNRRGEAENSVVEQPQDAVKVAAGIAAYDPETDGSVQDVFNRADAKMYQAKQAMKGGRAVR